MDSKTPREKTLISKLDEPVVNEWQSGGVVPAATQTVQVQIINIAHISHFNKINNFITSQKSLYHQDVS